MIVDTHCHYNLSPLYQDWQAHWKKAQSKGVAQSIVVGTSIETSKRSLEIAHQSKNLFSAVGVHPHQYSKLDPADIPTIISQQSSTLAIMLEDKQIVAIGETGLDYFRLDKKTQAMAIINQQAGFKMHLELANTYHKLLIVHVRDRAGNKSNNNQAYWDALKIIKSNYKFNQPLILHCLSGPKDYIKEAVKLGIFFGISANVTYPNAKELRNLIKLIPQKQLLLETDAPFLPPQEFRGQICEPWMITKTNSYLLDKLGVQIDHHHFASNYLSPVQ
jgi:TatD DNase family protein